MGYRLEVGGQPPTPGFNLPKLSAYSNQSGKKVVIKSPAKFPTFINSIILSPLIHE